VKIENVDAIVNASDVCLSNDGGVSKAILKACG
jgi:O-acetyl-ADP-ribose deacetylase (regulator of RNase III)